MMRKQRGFSRTEILVVFVVLGLMFLCLGLSTQRAKELENRVKCASNLGALGRALVMYQMEYRDRLPKAWGASAEFQCFGGGVKNRTGFNEPNDFKVNYFMNPAYYSIKENMVPEGRQNVGMCLYLLVRHEGVAPKIFVCPSAKNDRQMDLEDIARESRKQGYAIEFWRDMVNFQSMRNLSYSYHDPWNRFGVMEDSALLADKSSAFDTATGLVNKAAMGRDYKPHRNPDSTWTDNGGANKQHGNSKNHGTECQNVLFMNSSVKRVEHPLIGLGGDNIYTRWAEPSGISGTYSVKDKQILGQWGNMIKNLHALGRSDSYLGN